MTRILRNVIDDKRYKTKRWKDVRLRVLHRDGRRCWAKEEQPDGSLIPCPVMANIADHITPSSLAMPDHEFFSMANLRASCKRHNTARGVAARLDRETGQSESTTLRAGVHMVRASGFFRQGTDRDRPLASSTHTGNGRSLVNTRDYTRRPAGA